MKLYSFPMSYYCEICNNQQFRTKQSYHRHLLSYKHLTKEDSSNKKYKCPCGKHFSYRQGLYTHKKSCSQEPIVLIINSEVEQLRNENEELKKEHEEMKLQIALLLDKYAGSKTTTNNNTTTNSNNVTHNVDTQQNNTINININAFGHENLDYLDNQAITACIERVYKSIPALLEKIHFDPKHPENHNIKITNKKLPYASVMGDNKKWKTVDKKDAIETMVCNGYNLLDEKYYDKKDDLSNNTRKCFEGFQERFENEEKDLRKQLKTDVELLVMNSTA